MDQNHFLCEIFTAVSVDIMLKAHKLPSLNVAVNRYRLQKHCLQSVLYHPYNLFPTVKIHKD